MFHPLRIQALRSATANPVVSVQTARFVSNSVPLSFAFSRQVLAPRATKKTINKELESLKKQLKKEKQTYSKLKEKLAKEKKKVAEKTKKEKAKTKDLKDKEKTEKLLAKAFKNPRALSPYNIFVKEHAGTDIAEASKRWAVLAEDEKASYQEKADVYNQDLKSTYLPKPKAPTFGFAAYVKENYVSDGRKATDILPELSAQWKSLPDSEKAKYDKDEAEWKQYQEVLEQWKADRIKLFNSVSKTKIEI